MSNTISRRAADKLRKKRAARTTKERHVISRNRRRKIGQQRYMKQITSGVQTIGGRPTSENGIKILTWEKYEVLYQESSAMLLQNTYNIKALLEHPDLPPTTLETEEAKILTSVVSVAFVRLSATLHKIGMLHDMKAGIIKPDSEDAILAAECYNKYAEFDEVLLSIMARVADATVVVVDTLRGAVLDKSKEDTVPHAELPEVASYDNIQL